MTAKDITGQKFGRLTVVSRCENTGVCKGRPAGYVSYTVQCDCGKTMKAKRHAMESGNTRSCGCLNSDAIAASNRLRKSTHGMCSHPHFVRWNNMNRRCLNRGARNFADYGGRGISIWWHWSKQSGVGAVRRFCEWIDKNLGPCPDGYSLDRIDNNRGYMPDNLRWADDKTQANNKRK